MKYKNSIFLGVSLDNYIADKNGGLDWLNMIPLPEGEDMGYHQFMSGIDALVMGRTTFETVCGFDIEWPYQKPVFVLSSTLTEIPEDYRDKAFLLSGELKSILDTIHKKGYNSLYIDGGVIVQNFLLEDLIDEFILTTIPIILGDGVPLFAKQPKSIELELISSKIYADHIVQNHYTRKKK